MASSTLRKSVEQAKLLSKSGLVDKAWSKITTHEGPGLDQKTYQEGIYTIVVFASRSCPLDSGPPTPLSGPQAQNPFYFLRSENISSFSLHTPAYQLFVGNDLTHLKLELIKLLESKKHVIITGAALGGAVASLFTLWLLETVDPKFKRPLCITFGSPLIGDASLQQILENSLRNSCFLHVADAAQTPIQAGLRPFGTFLICVVDQWVCIDDPETVMELLSGANGDVIGWRDYGEVLRRLAQPLAADSGLMIDDGVINRMVERAENKKRRFDPLIKLNHMKMEMMHLEWYIKTSKMGYYDRFKTHKTSPNSQVDADIERRTKELNEYWTSVVEQVQKMPQSEESLLKTRSLYSANNYRRMVEPLVIAEYYLSGKTEYRATGRSPHYAMLEKLFKEKENKKEKEETNVKPPGRDLTYLLTLDSCFWADVEEAVIVTNSLKTQVVGGDVLPEKLVRFEKDVGEMLRKREVSPEIFLEESTFMKWWREYKEIRALYSPSSDFTSFMFNGEYKRYGQAC